MLKKLLRKNYEFDINKTKEATSIMSTEDLKNHIIEYESIIELTKYQTSAITVTGYFIAFLSLLTTNALSSKLSTLTIAIVICGLLFVISSAAKLQLTFSHKLTEAVKIRHIYIDELKKREDQKILIKETRKERLTAKYLLKR